MTFSKIGRIVTALVASAALGLGMTACGGGTIGYMWVLGTYYNQISGFKIDDYTGNLTSILHSPFNSGGSNPQMLAVRQGGRFLYVLNAGTGGSGTPNTTGYVAPQSASITEFSIGGGGELTFQNNYYTTYGFNPIYLTFDSTGSFLYVLD
jgi:6-phosphogluconolactonase (cycloisomerase 2 family)